MIKKILFGCVLLAVFTTYRSEAQFSAGPGVAYCTAYEEFGIQLRALYEVNERWQANFDFNNYFDKYPNFSLKEFDLDVHYVFLQKEKLGVYGLTGLNYFLLNSGFGRYAYPALNLGTGAQASLAEHIKAYLEIRYNLFGVPDQLVFSLGGVYAFQ